MSGYIMALDQGTTSSKAILFDHQGSIVASENQEFTQYYPKLGWVEHDPNEIWESQLTVAQRVLHAARSPLTRFRVSGSPISAKPPSSGIVPDSLSITRLSGNAGERARQWESAG